MYVQLRVQIVHAARFLALEEMFSKFLYKRLGL